MSSPLLSPLLELSSDIEDSPTPSKWLWSSAQADLGTAESTSSLLPELLSDIEDCPTPCKLLWSSESVANKDDDSTGTADSDASDDGPLPPPTFPSSDFIYSSPLVGTKQQSNRRRKKRGSDRRRRLRRENGQNPKSIYWRF